MQKWIILSIVVAIIVGVIVIMSNVNIETEYIPETEISETDLRKTIVTLYFQNKETKEMVKETRLIDSKELLLNPYEKMIEMLLTGPESADNENAIPQGTKLLKTSLENGVLIVTVSQEFLGNQTDENSINKSIEEISLTLRQFTEVTSVNVIVEGEIS